MKPRLDMQIKHVACEQVSLLSVAYCVSTINRINAKQAGEHCGSIGLAIIQVQA